MTQDNKNTKEYWEARSKSFPAYNENDAHHDAVLEMAKKHGAVFAGKNILDVGCGSGSYALRMAREAKHVTALDISAGMLAKLAESAKESGIKNIECVESDWSGYLPDNRFDVIFCSLTPAIATKEDVAKLMTHALGYIIYITSKHSVKTPLFDELFAMHNAERKITVFATVVRDWLTENNVKFDLVPIRGEREARQTHDEIMKNCANVLDAAGITPDIAKIKTLIEKYKTSDGEYISKTYYDTEMYVWRVSVK